MPNPTIQGQAAVVSYLQKLRQETRREPLEVLRYGEPLLSSGALDRGDDEGEHVAFEGSRAVADSLVSQCGLWLSRSQRRRLSAAGSSWQRCAVPELTSVDPVLTALYLQDLAGRLSKRFPDSPRVAVLVGMLLEAKGDPSEAKAYYDAILDKDETDIVSLALRMPSVSPLIPLRRRPPGNGSSRCTSPPRSRPPPRSSAQARARRSLLRFLWT